MGRHCTLGRSYGSLAVATVLALSIAFPVTAAPGGGLEWRAQLDGRALSLGDVARFHCHDRDFPLIRCFRSSAERDRDMRGIREPAREAASAEALTAVHYVTWYADADFREPPSFAAYWSEPDLTVYGWNDKISSFRTYNGGHPKWWQDVGYRGTAWDWGTVSQSYVGNPANDQFSSVERL